MKNLFKYLLLVSLFIHINAWADDNETEVTYDFFTGTVELAPPQSPSPLLLKRCDGASNQYWLIDHKPNVIAQFMQDYKQQLASASQAGKKIQLTVIGAYQQKNDENFLRVGELEDIKPNTSCHLADWLESLESEQVD